ncbi:isocitrate lyase/PEP mutase family protein [Afifella pfennigii]|uniref:isocitrate lyase/PEP mutase family protein n=1 Tax=Afifella pfennigii TaxID=209897 RepID=UPI00047D00EA|nr:isocitrate lyase/PEP mutase family protein [Afifella pfennigii]
MTSLKQRLSQPRLLSAPGVFDMISAKIADETGFEALYMTGFGTVASHLGLPDAGLATFTDMVGRVAAIAGGCRTPLIADGDTGYGGLLNVDFTVRGYERAGAAAIQIEDQEFPKKCGHTPGRRVVALEEMVRKIKVAVAARDSSDFLVIARTDARTAHGLDEALRRADAYAEAGADVLFVESPETEEEMERICRAIDLPLVANMVEGGRTPLLGKSRLEELGYRLAIFPASGFLAAGGALRAVYGRIRREGSSAGYEGELYPFSDFTRLMGFERVWEFEKRHADE